MRIMDGELLVEKLIEGNQVKSTATYKVHVLANLSCLIFSILAMIQVLRLQWNACTYILVFLFTSFFKCDLLGLVVSLVGCSGDCYFISFLIIPLAF